MDVVTKVEGGVNLRPFGGLVVIGACGKVEVDDLEGEELYGRGR